jgi:hypothetical protein
MRRRALYSEFCDITIRVEKTTLKFDKKHKISVSDLQAENLAFELQWLPSDNLFFVPAQINQADDALVPGTGSHKRLKIGEPLYVCLIAEDSKGQIHFAAHLDYSEQLGWSIELRYEYSGKADDGEFQRYKIGSVPLSLLLDDYLYSAMGGDEILRKLGLEASYYGVDDPIWYRNAEQGFSFSIGC